MKLELLTVVLLTTCCFGSWIEAGFEFEVSDLGYKFVGTGYVDWSMEFIENFETDIVAIFNGTMTDGNGKEFFTEGIITVPDPPLSNLKNIKFAGAFGEDSEKMTFSGKVKVSIWDILKAKIPFSGDMTYTDASGNSKSGSVSGKVENPGAEEEEITH